MGDRKPPVWAFVLVGAYCAGALYLMYLVNR